MRSAGAERIKGIMETKKINRLMVGIFLLHIVTVAILTVMAGKITIGVILNLSLGQLLLLAPAVVYLLCYKLNNVSVAVPVQDTLAGEMFSERGLNDTIEQEVHPVKNSTLRERLMYNKIRPSTMVYILFFVWLTMPLTTVINSASMFFTDNTIVGMSDMILSVPFPIMLFLMAVMPATIEELVFRGITYGGYRKAGTKFMAVMLSALMFGLMHGNLNQALYAFVLGILMALLVEATGSLFSSMLFHFIYNAQSCCAMFFIEAIEPGYYQDASNMVMDADQLFAVVSVYLVIAAVTTPLAFCMLYKIAKNEKRVAELMECLPKKQTGKETLVTPSFIIATIISVGYIIFDMIVSALAK